MKESKYLKLARQAREEGNSEDAKRYYDMVRTDDPENVEAKFFYAYYALYAGKNGEIPTRFSNLCTVVLSSVRMSIASDCEKAEKLETVRTIVDTFVPESWAMNRYMNNKNRETKVGDRYVQVFSTQDVTSCCRNSLSTLKELGDFLATAFGDGDAEGLNLAVVAWKEFVFLAQKWMFIATKGEAEQYAEKITKVDPSYQMPQKKCITFGDPNKR